jgi:hypothetical protein
MAATPQSGTSHHLAHCLTTSPRHTTLIIAALFGAMEWQAHAGPKKSMLVSDPTPISIVNVDAQTTSPGAYLHVNM